MDKDRAKNAFTGNHDWLVRWSDYRQHKEKSFYRELSSLSLEEYAQQSHHAAVQLLEFAKGKLGNELERVQKNGHYCSPYHEKTYRQCVYELEEGIDAINRLQSTLVEWPDTVLSANVDARTLQISIGTTRGGGVWLDYKKIIEIARAPIPEGMWECFAFLLGLAYTKAEIEQARKDYHESLDTFRRYSIDPEKD